MVLKKIRIFFGAILIVFMLLVVVFVVDLRQRNNAHHINEKDVAPFLKDGDVICRLGDRVWSLLFKEFSPVDKRFSHLGIIFIQGEEISVVNAQGDRNEGNDKVQTIPLEEFLEYAQQVGIYRLNKSDGSLLSKNALPYIGRPFDWDFNMDDDSKLYCSELLYVSLKDIFGDVPIRTVWVKELSKNIVPVDICSQSEYFTEIAYFEK